MRRGASFYFCYIRRSRRLPEEPSERGHFCLPEDERGLAERIGPGRSQRKRGFQSGNRARMHLGRYHPALNRGFRIRRVCARTAGETANAARCLTLRGCGARCFLFTENGRPRGECVRDVASMPRDGFAQVADAERQIP